MYMLIFNTEGCSIPGKVLSINIGVKKGTEKESVDEVMVIENWGLEGDAHAGDWDRQVSVFPVEALDKVPRHKIEEVLNGGYTENFTISGIPIEEMAIGKTLTLGDVEIKILHIGKEEFKDSGRPYIVSREGRFGRVIKGGRVRKGDEVKIKA